MNATIVRVLGWAALPLALLLAGCKGADPAAGEAIVEASQAVGGLSAAEVLGFERASGWTVSSGAAASTTRRTQGATALALPSPSNDADLVSAPIAANDASTAALTGLSD